MDVLGPELWRAVLGTVLSAAVLTGLRFMTPRAHHRRVKERLSRLDESTELAAEEVAEVDHLLDAHPHHGLGPVTMDQFERIRRLDVRRPPSPAVIHQARRAVVRSCRTEIQRGQGRSVAPAELRTLQSLAIRRCAAIESAAEISESKALARQRYVMQVGTSNTSRWGQAFLTGAMVTPIIGFFVLVTVRAFFPADAGREELEAAVMALSASVSVFLGVSGGSCAGYVRSRLLPPDRRHRSLLSVTRVVLGMVLGLAVGLLYNILWVVVASSELPY